MRLNCITFLDPDVHRGGGEMITQRLLRVGRERGHDIRLASVRPRQSDLHEEPQVTLLIDVFNHGHSTASLGAWRCFGELFLERAISRGPFVHLTTAYPDVCNLPYLPCSGHANGTCPHKPLPRLRDKFLLRDFGTACFATTPLVKRLFKEAALNVFFSPLHRAVTEQLLGIEGGWPTLLLKPMVDTTLFKNHGGARDIEYLFVGVISEAKGLEAMRSRFAGTDIHLVGRLAPGAKLDFGMHVPHVPYAEIPGWMNRAKHLVFLPRWPEPQGRVVTEAALCGCALITNANVGALSFDFDLADPANYRDVEGNFWQALEALT